MRIIYNIIVFCLITVSFCLLSCSGRKINKRRITLDTISVSAKNNPLNTYRASTNKEWEIINTRVALSFNWKEKTAKGEAWLKIRPYFYSSDSLVLDAKTMQIEGVILADTKKTIPFHYKDDKLVLNFGSNYKMDDTLLIHIKYTATPYKSAAGGSRAINDDKGLYFINTDYALPNKPAQIWTQGETESNSHWVPTIDKPNQRTTTRIELTVPDSFTTLSNGYLAKQTTANGMRTDIWVMDKPIQVYVMMFAIGKYAIVKDKEVNGKEVSYYVEPAYAPYAKTMFKHTPEMINYFSDVTGVPYPWNKYSQVVARDYVSGAMENTTATLFGEFINQNDRENKDRDYEDVVSHELFHQWFGDYVTAESWSNLTLNESFATYGEQLWRRYKYGKASVDKTLRDDLNAYLTSNNTEPLVRFYYHDKEDMFDRVSYQKGSVILHYLHQLIGDEAFSAAMQIYLKRNALHAAEATQWRLAVEEATGKDWNWFFNQWYYRGGHPKLDIKYSYDDELKQLTIDIAQKQKEPVFKLPLKAAIVYGTEKTIVDWDIDSRNRIINYPYKNGVKPLVIPDVNHWLVGTIAENKNTQDWLATYKNCGDDIVTRIICLEQIKKNMDDIHNQSIIALALQDKEPYIKEYVLGLLTPVTNNQLQTKWKADVMYIVANESNNAARAAALNTLGYWKITEAKAQMYEALQDSSYSVAGAALSAIGRLDKDTAYILAKRMHDTNPKGELENTIWDIIGENADANDIALFEKAVPYYYGNKKIAVAHAMSLYLQNVKNEPSFDKAVAVLSSAVKAETIKSYRQATGLYLLEVAYGYKQKKNSSRSNVDAAAAERRLMLLKEAIDIMIKEETDEGNIASYKNYLKTIFG